VIATTRLPGRSAELGKDDEVREAVRAIFGAGAAAAAGPVSASASTSWAAGGHGPELAVDGKPGTRWNAADGTRGDQWLEVDLGGARTVDGVRIREPFDRVTAYRVQGRDGARWIDLAAGSTIGREKTESFGPVTVSRVRLLIDRISSDSASISELDVLQRGRSVLAAPSIRNTHPEGGKAWFLPRPDEGALRAVLDEAIPVPDIGIRLEGRLPGGNLSALHAVLDGRDIYFLANSSDAEVDAELTLRGRHDLEAWDPHTGAIAPFPAAVDASGEGATRGRLRLPPVRSVFLVGSAPPR